MKISSVVFAILCLFSAQVFAQQVTNVTNVISGKLSRAGSTNRKAYDDRSLAALCEQGYTLAIYVYGGAKAHDVSCSRGKISYLSMTSWEHPTSILSRISNEMNGRGKVMVHCWYGVHASNFVTSAALINSCGFSGEQAAETFRRGVPPKSLAPARVNQLAAELVALELGNHVIEGCPSPR
jgi:hypothetical protein